MTSRFGLFDLKIDVQKNLDKASSMSGHGLYHPSVEILDQYASSYIHLYQLIWLDQNKSVPRTGIDPRRRGARARFVSILDPPSEKLKIGPGSSWDKDQLVGPDVVFPQGTLSLSMPQFPLEERTQGMVCTLGSGDLLIVIVISRGKLSLARSTLLVSSVFGTTETKTANDFRTTCTELLTVMNTEEQFEPNVSFTNNLGKNVAKGNVQPPIPIQTRQVLDKHSFPPESKTPNAPTILAEGVLKAIKSSHSPFHSRYQVLFSLSFPHRIQSPSKPRTTPRHFLSPRAPNMK
jgi:hypothetical protein